MDGTNRARRPERHVSTGITNHIGRLRASRIEQNTIGRRAATGFANHIGRSMFAVAPANLAGRPAFASHPLSRAPNAQHRNPALVATPPITPRTSPQSFNT